MTTNLLNVVDDAVELEQVFEVPCNCGHNQAISCKPSELAEEAFFMLYQDCDRCTSASEDAAIDAFVERSSRKQEKRFKRDEKSFVRFNKETIWEVL